MMTAAYVSIAAYVVILLGAAAFLGLLSKCYLQARGADHEEERRRQLEREAAAGPRSRLRLMKR